MANLNEQEQWEAGVYQIEQTDPVVGGPGGTSNTQAQQLANRTAYLKSELEAIAQDVQSVGTDGQNALWSGLERALSEIGVLVKELDRQQRVRHQEGVFTVYNRGVKSGCGLSKSQTASRNLNLAQGVCFMLGDEHPVVEDDNAASVPGNSGSEAATAKAYLYIVGGYVRLAVTGLGEDAPDDGLVLAELSIPAGNTGANDSFLDNVTITSVARQEPEWPSVQLDPGYAQVDFPLPMDGANYAVSLDVDDFVGGEPPVLRQPAGDRASNTFRVYINGMTDSARVRYVAHLMDQ